MPTSSAMANSSSYPPFANTWASSGVHVASVRYPRANGESPRIRMTLSSRGSRRSTRT